MTFDIDPCLDSLAVPYLTLPNATAWETLQSIADFALCRFYAARDGRIRAEYDMCTCPKTPLPNVAITPDNTFSHRLPLQPKLIVNRVVVPYTELVPGDPEDDKIALKESDARQENGRLVFEVPFKNFYPRISNLLILEVNSPIDVDLKIKKINYSSCIIDTQIFSFERNISLQINSDSIKSFKQFETISQTSDTNIKANGLNEYAHPLSPLMISKEIADIRAKSIRDKYGEGLEYTEVEWKGTPELKVGDKVLYNAPSETSVPYTCVSNEMTFTGGLRCKMILRKE